MAFRDRFFGRGAGWPADVMRAGSEPLPDVTPTHRRDLGVSESALRANKFDHFQKPNPQQVIRQAMETNPYVYQVVEPPAMVAGLIPIYPVFGLKSGRPKRANPDGNLLEKTSIEVLRQYADDCGSQANLISRSFAAQRATGEEVQVRYKTREGKTVYEIVQNDPKILEQNRDKSWTWYRSADDKVRIERGDARRSFKKSFMHTRKAMSTLLPLVDLIAAWELTHKALSYQVKTGMLLGGMVVGPDEETSDGVDWTKDWFHWIKQMAKEDTWGMPYPMKIPGELGKVQFLSPGMTVQEGHIALEALLAKSIARFSGIDPTLVLDGSGAASHWNGILMQRNNLQSFIWPTTKLQVLENVVAWPFRPALEETGLGFDLEDWGIDGDWRQIAIQPDQLDKLMEMSKLGWIPEEIPMGGIGLEPSEVMEPGSREWERFVARQKILASSRRETGNEPSRDPVGVGGEVFGDDPDNEADSSANPNPTPRAELSTAKVEAEFSEITKAFTITDPREDESETWDAYGQW